MFLEERVLGEKRKGVTCEEIGEEKILQNISVSDKILKAKPLTSLQVVYFWNEKQLKFLLEDKRLVLFLADFGVGKTLMKKHKALSVASQNQDVEVIYLSLAQAVRHEETHQGKSSQLTKMNQFLILQTDWNSRIQESNLSHCKTFWKRQTGKMGGSMYAMLLNALYDAMMMLICS